MASASDMSAVRAKLAFTCTHEADRLPPLDSNADVLFKYGRSLEKKEGPKNFDDIARYYRIAAAFGHYKANNNLQGLLTSGLASSPDAATEAVDLAIQLIKAGVPGGYYDMGHYLEQGYGIQQDADQARRYFRKAADLGSPDAQYYVAELLAPLDKAPDIAKQMRQCATDQGFGKAASALGVDLKTNNNYADAIKSFQKGVEAGDSQSASFLENGFGGQKPSAPLYYMALPYDAERSRRYGAVWEFLTDHESLNPKVPDIDQIVPLPPAKLPEWDGTFQWQKERDAATPPPKPAESLVTKLAREKDLDPATGLPLKPAKTAEAERVPLGTTAYTKEVCPQDGVWCAKQWTYYSQEATQHFSKGQTMPDLLLRYPRSMKMLDALLGVRESRTPTTWSLVAYPDEAV